MEEPSLGVSSNSNVLTTKTSFRSNGGKGGRQTSTNSAVTGGVKSTQQKLFPKSGSFLTTPMSSQSTNCMSIRSASLTVGDRSKQYLVGRSNFDGKPDLDRRVGDSQILWRPPALPPSGKPGLKYARSPVDGDCDIVKPNKNSATITATMLNSANIHHTKPKARSQVSSRFPSRQTSISHTNQTSRQPSSTQNSRASSLCVPRGPLLMPEKSPSMQAFSGAELRDMLVQSAMLEEYNSKKKSERKSSGDSLNSVKKTESESDDKNIWRGPRGSSKQPPRRNSVDSLDTGLNYRLPGGFKKNPFSSKECSIPASSPSEEIEETAEEQIRNKLTAWLGSVGETSKDARSWDPKQVEEIVEFAMSKKSSHKSAEEIYSAYVEHLVEEANAY